MYPLQKVFFASMEELEKFGAALIDEELAKYRDKSVSLCGVSWMFLS
jgi:hypothetical protein